jgi:hypothetical protein
MAQVLSRSGSEVTVAVTLCLAACRTFPVSGVGAAR